MVTVVAPQRAPLRSLPTHRPDRRTALTAVILGSLGVALSASGSWIPSLWGDEVASVLSAERSLPSLFTMLGHVDAVHGSYYLFLHFWVRIFGASPFSVRFPSAIAVGVMVAGVVLLGKRLGGPRMALLAGVLAVVLPRATYTGEEARSYAMSAAVAVWVTLLLVKLVSDLLPSKRMWVLYGIGIAACAYIFLFTLLVLAAHAALVLSLRRRSLTISWLKSVGLGVALALPVLIYGFAERSQISFRAHRSSATFSDIWVSQWFQNDATAIVGWALLILAIAVPVALRALDRRAAGKLGITGAVRSAPKFMPLIVTWLLAPTVLLVAVNAVHSIYSSRYLSFCVPAVALAIASLLTRIPRVWIAYALVVALAGTAAPSYLHDRTPYAKNGSDWTVDAAVIQSKAHTGDGIIFDESATPSKDPRLAMGAYPSAFAGLKDIELKAPWYNTIKWHDTVYPLADVVDRLNGVDTVWVIEYRAPGSTADTYDLSALESLGYSPAGTIGEHSSVLIELDRS